MSVTAARLPTMEEQHRYLMTFAETTAQFLALPALTPVEKVVALGLVIWLDTRPQPEGPGVRVTLRRAELMAATGLRWSAIDAALRRFDKLGLWNYGAGVGGHSPYVATVIK